MSFFDKPPQYLSFLITFWQERSLDPNGPIVWRFSLEDPRADQRRGFPTLKTLVDALEQELRDAENR